ncbi:unnamed protein product [Porites evermanni]|uniref:Uncharacterized protein n=1 Tax=Porites evermanni TaxID=104178 RepID=A0ABN8Q7P7_9CNID|nr:unnamed protein product [Porites evermanni]
MDSDPFGSADSFHYLTVTCSIVPKRVSPLAIDQEMVKLRARAQWVGPGRLPSPWAGKSGLRVSKVNQGGLNAPLDAVTLEQEDIFNSHDVVSLFTKTPIQETLTIIRERLEKGQDLKKRTNIEVDDIMDLT